MLVLDRSQRRRRTMAMVVILAAYVVSFFQRFAPAGVAPDLAAAFATTASSLGGLAATYFYVYMLMQVPTGILVDTLGPRRILLIGGLVASFGSLLFGLATTLEMAFIGRTLVGLGVSVTFISLLKIIAVWFDDNRFASVVGLAMLIGNLGSILAGAPLSAVAQTLGWRSVFVGIAIISLLAAIGSWLFVRDHPNGEVAGTRPHFDRTVILSALLAVVRNRATWPAMAINFSVSGSFFAFGGLWAMPFLTQGLGMSRALASAHVSLYFASFALGCVIIGALSDRLGLRKPVLVVTTNLYALSWLPWVAGVTLPLAASYALFVVMGLLTASYALTWACAKEVNPPLLSGMSTSVTNIGGFLAGALLQPLFGWVMDTRWAGVLSEAGVRVYALADYQAGALLLAATACIGAFAAWHLRETKCRNIWPTATLAD